MSEESVKSKAWCPKLGARAGKMVATFGFAGSVAILILPLVEGGSGAMPKQAKGTIGNVHVILEVIKGAIRYQYFWSDVSGFGNKLWFLVDRGKVVETAIARSSQRLGQQHHGSREAEKLLTEDGENAAVTESRLQKMLGRKIDELMGTIFGVIVSITTIVLVSIDLSREKNPLMIASDTFMIASEAILILGIVAGRLVALRQREQSLDRSFAAFKLLGTWAGLVAVALALIGIIHYDVKMSLTDTLNELIGPSIKARMAQIGINISPGYMHVTPPLASDTIPPTACLTLDIASSLIYSTNGIWGVDTNATGGCRHKRYYYCLASKADKSGVEMTKKPTMADADYQDALKQPDLAPSGSDNKDALPRPSSALVAIGQGQYMLNLVVDLPGHVTGFSLTLLGIDKGVWLLEMQPMASDALGKGITWTVTPPLPEPFELVQGSGGRTPWI
ncbi:hypothetical protein N657DRAFT_631937 [Parathielavia appendiculata]|uniref:Uncharacterized protein n=1 Tax=Parathielavia appendiculata TaxID=2587402 RepID=A0AAN6U3D2_9PEZI|nr:hypothetical protein N657DRAFT_631937 [Parathielavia appendiculata]